MESEPMLTPRDKSLLPEKKSPQTRIEPTTLHQAGQGAQHSTNELFQPRPGSEPCFPHAFSPDWVIPMTYKLVFKWLPCQMPAIIGSVLGLAVSILWDSKFDPQLLSQCGSMWNWADPSQRYIRMVLNCFSFPTESLKALHCLSKSRSPSSAVPARSLGVHHFCVCDNSVFFVFFFNPTIEVITFCLHGKARTQAWILLLSQRKYRQRTNNKKSRHARKYPTKYLNVRNCPRSSCAVPELVATGNTDVIIKTNEQRNKIRKTD